MANNPWLALAEDHAVLTVEKIQRYRPDLEWVDTSFAGECSCGEDIGRCSSVERLRELHREHLADEAMAAFVEKALTGRQEGAIGRAVTGDRERVDDRVA